MSDCYSYAHTAIYSFEPRKQCPKCGKNYIETKYEEKDAEHDERLRLTCMCGYSWVEKCLDAKK